ncbi:MAG TPA: hypothetical protein VN517_03715 [Terriglobales bacterium]|nr:hypothetical protein [Terriglobales bacterium]
MLASATPEQELIQDIGNFSADPLGYTRYAFPWLEGELEDAAGPRQWQREILSVIGEHLKSDSRFTPLELAVSSGHGIGKTALIAMVCSWAKDTCEDCRIVVTANTESQLATKTWPEICKWTRLAITSHWWNIGATTISVKEKAHERQWRIDRIPWSENNTEAFAGLHNKGKRIVVIYDEASAIADSIWEVTEGALTDEGTEIIWIAFGNPTKNAGRFRECFGRYKHRWRTCQIDSRGIEGTNKVQLDKWVADYGEDSDFVRVRVRGEFPRAGSTQFIAGDVVSAARNRKLAPEKYESHWKILICDVARFGDDQTIIGIRQGPKFTILDKLRELSTVQTANRVMQRMKEHDPRTTVIDGDGVGGGVVDYVREYMTAWFNANPARRLMEFHGGAAPNDAFMYFNYRANMWGAMRDWLATAQIPDDPELESDLTGPEYYFSAKNQIQLEKKEDMKKRGLASPDLGDTLAMSFCAYTQSKTQEETDRDKLAATNSIAERSLLQYKLTMERDSRLRRAEERRPAHWE